MFDFLPLTPTVNVWVRTWGSALGCAAVLSLGGGLYAPRPALAASHANSCTPATGHHAHGKTHSHKPSHKASTAAAPATAQAQEDPLRQPVRQAIRQAALQKPRDLKADIRNGVVDLRGWLYSQSELDRVKQQLLQVPGVTRVYTNRVRLWSSRASDKSRGQI